MLCTSLKLRPGLRARASLGSREKGLTRQNEEVLGDVKSRKSEEDLHFAIFIFAEWLLSVPSGKLPQKRVGLGQVGLIDQKIGLKDIFIAELSNFINYMRSYLRANLGNF